MKPRIIHELCTQSYNSPVVQELQVIVVTTNYGHGYSPTVDARNPASPCVKLHCSHCRSHQLSLGLIVLRLKAVGNILYTDTIKCALWSTWYN